MKVTFNVEGMSCQHCAKAVVSAVEKLGGVTHVAVDLEAKTVAVDCENTAPEDIAAAIEEEGYEVISGRRQEQ